MKRVTYILSDINKSLQLEWILLPLNKSFDIKIILIGTTGTAIERSMTAAGISVFVLDVNQYSSRVGLWFGLVRRLREIKPHVVHCHLWNACLLGITASWLLRVKKRIFTRHHGNIHYTKHPSGQKWDRLINRLATDIVSISQVTSNILVEFDKADPAKVVLIHHGFDFDYFNRVDASRVSELKRRHDIPATRPVVGVIARYTEWKGVQFVIDAFAKFKSSVPTAHLLLANAHGDYKHVITEKLTQLPSNSYTEIQFEEDLAALYHSFDYYVHVPTDAFAEAFGQTYVEALAAGVPSIFTLAGVSREFIQDGHNALTCNFSDAEGLYLALNKLHGNTVLQRTVVANGRYSLAMFQLATMIAKLKKLYDTTS